MPVVKASEKLLDMLNQAIAREIQVSIQYMWQHVQWSGVKGFAVQEELKQIAIAEMKHAETIAERLFYLGGIPTTKPSPIFVGNTRSTEATRSFHKQLLQKAIESMTSPYETRDLSSITMAIE